MNDFIPVQQLIETFFKDNSVFMIVFITGALYCLMGYRLFYISLFIASFIIFAFISFLLLGSVVNTQLLTTLLIVSLLIGILGAILSLLFLKAGIFLLGFIGGCSVSFIFSSVFDTPILPILFGLIGGILALVLEKPTLIIATASIGALLIFWSILQILQNSNIIQIDTEPNPTYFYLISGFCWFSLTAVGSAFQYHMLFKK